MIADARATPAIRYISRQCRRPPGGARPADTARTSWGILGITVVLLAGLALLLPARPAQQEAPCAVRGQEILDGW
ncbi:MAG TPA: hypothetical protein VIZ43_21210 [Trebonia sp.]